MRLFLFPCITILIVIQQYKMSTNDRALGEALFGKIGTSSCQGSAPGHCDRVQSWSRPRSIAQRSGTFCTRQVFLQRSELVSRSLDRTEQLYQEFALPFA